MVAKVIGGKNLRVLILSNKTKVSQEVANFLFATGFGVDARKHSVAQKLESLLKSAAHNTIKQCFRLRFTDRILWQTQVKTNRP